MRHALPLLVILVALVPAAPATAQKAIERAETLIGQFEAVQRGELSIWDLPRDLPQRIDKRIEELDAYLVRSPTSVPALLASARLDWLRAVARPVQWSPAAGETPPRMELSGAHDKLERALASDPENPELHYWQARLYGIREPVVTKEHGLSFRCRDLDKAIECAQRAVDLAPRNETFCEALALFLVDAERFSEASAAVDELRGGRHPMHLLLADRAAFPFPESVSYSKHHSDAFGSFQRGKGRYAGFAYPELRVNVYTFPGPVSELEQSLRQRWPDLVLFETERQELDEGRVIRTAQQFFRFEGDELVPSTSREQAMQGDSDGIRLGVTETANPSAEDLVRFEMEPTETMTVIFTLNFRSPA